MLDHDDIRQLLNRFTYKPGVKVELSQGEPSTVTISNGQHAVEAVPDMAIDSEEMFWMWLRILVVQLERYEVDKWFRVDGEPYA